MMSSLLGFALASLMGCLALACSSDGSETDDESSTGDEPSGSGGQASSSGGRAGVPGGAPATGNPAKDEIWAEGLGDGVNLGIAKDYLEDVGIADDEWVYAAEGFETGTVELTTEDDRLREDVEVVSAEAYTGAYSARMSWPQGHAGRVTRHPLPADPADNPTGAYFVRLCYRYDASFHPGGDASAGVGVKGFGITANPERHDNQVPCDGSNWYNGQVQFVGWGPSQKEQANDGYLWVGHAYSYNPDPNAAVAAFGNPELRLGDYRLSAYADPYEYLRYDTWRCFEVGLYVNTPGDNDGELRFWIDGVLQSRTVNLRFRDIATLLPDFVSINLYRTTTDFPQTMVRHLDNIVISRRYIGPVAR